jgi:hypothetical protein
MMRPTNLNFITTAPPIRGWRSVVLLLGVVTLVLCGQRWAMQAKATAALQTQLTQIRPPPLVKPARNPAQQRELESQSKIVSEAVRQLNLPIADLMKSLQAPKDIRVALVGLDLSAKGGSTSADTGPNSRGGLLKIAGEARTPQEMMSYVAFLDDQPLFKSVYLVKHELNLTSAEPAYRFLLEAQWRQ